MGIEVAAPGCCLSSAERLRRRAQGVDCFCDSYVPLGFFLPFRFASDLAEQGGSAASGWRTRDSPGSELSQGHVQRGVAQWQDLVSDPSRKNPQSGAARWPETPLQVCRPLVGDLEPQPSCVGALCCSLAYVVIFALCWVPYRGVSGGSLPSAGSSMPAAGGGCAGMGSARSMSGDLRDRALPLNR